MKKTQTLAALAAGGLLAASGIGFAANQASADQTPSPSDASTSSSTSNGNGPAGQGRHGDQGPRGDQTLMATNLATELGVDQAKVTTALEEIRAEHRAERDAANDPTTRPSDAERTDALATALAEKLDVDKQDVLDALDKLEADRNTQRAEHMTERLDAAVSAGDLTQAEADAVAKSVQKGVMGGAMGGGRR